MFWFFLPVFIVVISNVIYDVSAKSIREDLNAYAGITIIYSILVVFYFFAFIVSSPSASISIELSKVNWAVLTFALATIGLESGYIFLFRAGWNISLGGMVCNVLLAMCMLVVGQLLFRETVSFIQYLGVVFCITGLILVFQAGGNKTSEEEKEDIAFEELNG